MTILRACALAAAFAGAGIAASAAGTSEPESVRVRAGAVVRFAGGGRQPGHVGAPGALSPDGRFIAIVATDGTLAVSETSSGRITARVGRLVRSDAAAFSPDGKRLVAALADGHVKLVDPATDKLLCSLTAEEYQYTSATFSPTGRYLAVVAEDRGIAIIDAIRGSVHFYVPAISHGDIAAAFAPDGDLLATVGRDGGLDVWDLARRTCVLKLAAFRRGGFSPDGRFLLAAYGVKTVSLLEMPSAKERLHVTGESVEFTSVEFSSDSKTLATMCGDGALRVWDPTCGKARSQFRASTGGRLALDLSPRAGVLAPWLVDDHSLVADLVIVP